MSNSNKQMQADPFGNPEQNDAYCESLLQLKLTDPEKFKKLSPGEKMSLGYYVERKEKEKREGKI